jgi:hypothetical protein
MAFSSGDVLTAANLNDLNIDSIIVDTSTLVVDKTNNRVGIGDATPAKTFQVTESDSGVTPSASHHVLMESSDDMGLLIASGTTKNGYVRFGDSDSSASGGFNYDHNNNSLKIRTNGTDHITIDSAGDVGVGVSSPLRALDVDTDFVLSNGNTAYLWQVASADGDLHLWSKTASGDTGWSGRVYMTLTATSWASGSDRRIKRDIVDHSGNLADILGLQVRSYNFKDDTADQPARYGFITDEIPDSLAHLVTGEAGAVTVDEETGEETPIPQGLFYTDLIPHLVGAIQEQQKQIEELTARITALENA